MQKYKIVVVSILVFVLLFNQASMVEAQDSIVRIMLFYSPSCGHCANLISNDLPPIVNPYYEEPELYYIPPPPEEEAVGPSLFGVFGDSLEILYVNTMTEVGIVLYRELVEQLSIPADLQAVPTMIVGEHLLVGGGEIPSQLPGIIESGLATGGIDWVDLPSMDEALAQLVLAPDEPVPTEDPGQVETHTAMPTEDEPGVNPTKEPESGPTATVEPIDTSTETPANIVLEPEFSVLDRIKMDLTGNVMAIVVLIGMVISIAIVGSRLIFPEPAEGIRSVSWLIPLISLVGIIVAAYLTYVETSGTEAVCGPVGDCNTVQQSKYAVLFGLIPVGVVGLAGYVAIIIAWLVAKFSTEPLATWAKLALLGMSMIGTLFSIYLTFLEPFVIGATCAWCVTSAIIITLIMWLAVQTGTEALVELRGENGIVDE